MTLDPSPTISLYYGRRPIQVTTVYTGKCKSVRHLKRSSRHHRVDPVALRVLTYTFLFNKIWSQIFSYYCIAISKCICLFKSIPKRCISGCAIFFSTQHDRVKECVARPKNPGKDINKKDSKVNWPHGIRKLPSRPKPEQNS